MSHFVSLKNGALRCEVNPALGGCITGLWCGNNAILQSSEPIGQMTVKDAASFVMLPFSNRIGNGKVHWLERDYLLTQNFAPEPHAIHGIGWQRAWSVLSQNSSAIVLGLEHFANADWPFGFYAEQSISLHESKLKMRLQITNTTPQPVPVGMGWHPYFVKRKGAKLSFSSAGRWEMGADKLPLHRKESEGIQQRLEALDVDHCFDGWDGSLLLEDAVHQCIVESDMSRLVVYTKPDMNRVAIEPVSHVNNALQMADKAQAMLDLGVKTLMPEQSFACNMQITITSGRFG